MTDLLSLLTLLGPLGMIGVFLIALKLRKPKERLRFRTLPVAERLALRETCGLDLAKLGVLCLLEGEDGPTDGREGIAELARNRCHIYRASFAAQHGAYDIVPEPLLYGG